MDLSLIPKANLLAMLDTAMGGRAAEELIFGAENVTTGASSDLSRATSIATQMIKDWGMSEKIGLRTLSSKKGALSPNTMNAVDDEIRMILDDSYERAKSILVKHAKEHKLLAEALIKHESLDMEQVKIIIAGGKI